MKKYIISPAIVPGIFLVGELQAQEKKVLVFHKTEGFWHESIPAGYQAIEDLGDDHGFDTDETDDANDFNKEI
jgi:uncharacterized protein